jgi:hypothetical protein
MSGYRTLLCAVLIAALVLPMAAQAKANAAPLAGPEVGYHLTARKCHTAGCACPCCRQTGNTGHKWGCRCVSISFLPGLPSAGAIAPVQHESSNYSAFIEQAAPKNIIADIFRPPKS